MDSIEIIDSKINEANQTEKADFLLSICIPTYNRAKLLYSCLLSIFKQLDQSLINKVEIVLSNNQSTDSTKETIQEFFAYSNFKYFEQQENIGLARNVIEVVKHATGEFCWIVGDDDFLLQGSINSIVETIEKNLQISYFYASVKSYDVNEFKKISEPFDTTKYSSSIITKLDYIEVDRVEQLVTPEYSIIFLGEIMASIFRRSIWLAYKGNFEGEFLDTLETTYPHVVVFANMFFGLKAIYIKTPVILALSGAREWYPKLGYLIIVHVKNLLELYEQKGLQKTDLEKCNRKYIEISFDHFLKYISKQSEYQRKISVSKYLGFLLSHPLMFSEYIVKRASKKVKKTIGI